MTKLLGDLGFRVSASENDTGLTPKVKNEGDERKTWIARFNEYGSKGSNDYSVAGSHAKSSINNYKKNPFRNEQERDNCMIYSVGGRDSAYKTIGLSAENIDVDPWFNDFMDAIRQVKRTSTTE